MSQSVIEAGEKIHVMIRRHFKEEVRRHFAGEVTAATLGQIRVEGYTFTCDPVSLIYRRLPELRTRIFGLNDSGYIINVIPKEVDISRLRYHTNTGVPILTDGQGFTLEVNEFKGIA
jgi:hypothetical protein